MGLLEKFRKWLDADYEETGTEGSDREARPKNRAEEFLVNIAREIEKVMKAEMFTPPGGPTYIPPNYIVFLSPEDDADWRGEKRKGLEQGLFHVLSEQATAMLGDERNLQTRSFSVELRVDGTLEKGQFRVQAVWDTETEKTVIRPRKNKQIAEPETPENEETIVRPRSLFSLIVSRTGEKGEKTYNFSQPRISIGRGSSQTKVDLPLQGDMEISRHQATIEYQNGHFKLICEGRNPVVVNGTELLEGDSVEVTPGQPIEMSTFIIKINMEAKAVNRE